MKKNEYVVNLYNEDKKKRTNYVDNKRLLEELTAYRQKYQKAEQEGRDRPKPSDFIGKCILDICERLALRKNFFGYSYREEMIDDAIVDCVSAVKNFDPSKSKYPFTYFSKIAYFAFLRRIKREHDESYVKHSGINNLLAEGITEEELKSLGYVRNDSVDRFLETYETKKRKKK